MTTEFLHFLGAQDNINMKEDGNVNGNSSLLSLCGELMKWKVHI